MLLSDSDVTDIDTEVAGGGRNDMNLKNPQNAGFSGDFGQSVQRQRSGHHVRKELRLPQQPIRHYCQCHVHGFGPVREYLARPDLGLAHVGPSVVQKRSAVFVLEPDFIRVIHG